MISSSGDVFEAVATASRVVIESCDGCKPSLIVDGRNVFATLDPQACNDPLKASEALASNAMKASRGYVILKRLLAAADAIALALLMALAAILNLSPLVTGIAIGVLVALAAVAQAIVTKSREGGGTSTVVSQASIELLATRIQPFIEAYCSRCKLSVPGYGCRVRGRRVVLKRLR